jgi:hypothetical protein
MEFEYEKPVVMTYTIDELIVPFGCVGPNTTYRPSTGECSGGSGGKYVGNGSQTCTVYATVL